MFASKDIFLKSSGGYQISRSVRFRASATAYFNRTAGTPTNQNKWTWSGWIKRGALTGGPTLLSGGSTANDYQAYIFNVNSTNELYCIHAIGGANQSDSGSVTTALYRDPSAWYHFVIVYDSANATAANRYIVYVNGVQQTVSAYPSLNENSYINASGQIQYIGQRGYSSLPYDGYMTEINFVDGQALTPSSFGETNTLTGVWQPKKYAGTYGNNGYYLNFSDNSAATAATIGKDYSGNGNNWTPNNISVTAGVTYDSMLDVPTSYDDGTVYDRGNYPVINPLNNSGGTTIADGNLKTTWGSASSRSVLNTMAIPDSGKFYAEFVVGTLTSASVAASFGLATASVSRTSDGYGASGAWVYYASNQSYISRNGTSSAQIGSNQTFAAGGIVQVAVDRTNNQAWLGYNNVWVNATNGTDGNPSAGTNPTVSSLPADLFIIMGLYANSGNVNFGQRPFSYTPPTGFVALNTQNLPAPTISNGAQYMAATLYTGTDGVAGSVTGVGFSPDFVWVKSRSGANSHGLFDTVRGVQNGLFSNLTNAEISSSTYLTAFNSNGFSHGGAGLIANGSLVSWNWKANGTAVSNTAGSITSSVSANTTAGFSVVTFTTPSTNTTSTIGHGLGIAPSLIIVKSRSTTSSWYVYHSSLGATKAVFLNTTAASDTSQKYWNNTSPTSSVFTIMQTGVAWWDLNATHVAYCFAEVAGYSKFGSYAGNGSTDGTFVYTGFRPRFVMIKRTDTAGNSWLIYDTARVAYNANDLVLYPNLSNVEDSGVPIDILSNGFKQRTSWTNGNASGGTYIFMAVAENPFKLSLAR